MAQNQKKSAAKTQNTSKHRVPGITARIDRMVDGDGSTKAYASVNVAGAVAIHGIRVIDSDKGLFVSMPSRSYTDRNGKTQYSDIAHAVTKEAHDAINEKVLEAYQQELSESESEDQSETEDEDLPFDEDESAGFAPAM